MPNSKHIEWSSFFELDLGALASFVEQHVAPEVYTEGISIVVFNWKLQVED